VLLDTDFITLLRLLMKYCCYFLCCAACNTSQIYNYFEGKAGYWFHHKGHCICRVLIELDWWEALIGVWWLLHCTGWPLRCSDAR